MAPKFKLRVEYPSKYFNEYEPKVVFAIGKRRCDSGHNFVTGVRDICSDDWKNLEEMNDAIKQLEDLKLPELRILIPN